MSADTKHDDRISIFGLSWSRKLVHRRIWGLYERFASIVQIIGVNQQIGKKRQIFLDLSISMYYTKFRVKPSDFRNVTGLWKRCGVSGEKWL